MMPMPILLPMSSGGRRSEEPEEPVGSDGWLAFIVLVLVLFALIVAFLSQAITSADGGWRASHCLPYWKEHPTVFERIEEPTPGYAIAYWLNDTHGLGFWCRNPQPWGDS